MWNKIKFILNFLAFAKNPKRTELIFNFIAAVRSNPKKRPIFQEYEKIYLANPGFRKMWEERYEPKLTIEKLKAMPEGSFGRAFINFLESNNLDLHFYPEIEIKEPIDYFILRQYQTHDMLHAILGMDISHRSELAIQAFSLSQTKSALPAIIISGGLLHEAQNSPKEILGHFEAMFQLYRLGKETPSLYGIRLEDLLPEPLEKVRMQLLPSQAVHIEFQKNSFI